MFSGMTRRLTLSLAALALSLAQAVTPAAAAETGVQADGRFVVAPAAAKVIGDYLNRVSGRFGALAVSRDGQVAAFYICQSRLWKNCDDSSLEDSFMSIPSGRLAGPLAQQRCRGITGSDCIVLFINERWQRPFVLQQ
jgi:hypothetical protein